MKRLIGVRLDGTEVVLVEGGRKLGAGEQVQVPGLPLCDFCQLNGENRKAEYDFATTQGSWANGCAKHWQMHRAQHTLGVGKGQLLIDSFTVHEVMVDHNGENVAS